MTIIEVTVAVTILAILSVTVSALYIQALRMYARGTREATSRDKASLALQRMIPDIREAYNVDYPGPNLIVFTMPKRAANGRYLVDPGAKTLTSGMQVSFYQSDHTGSFYADGNYIWRTERPDPHAEWSSTGMVMDDVEDLSFTYAPSVELLELVQVAITIGQGTHPGYFNRTEVAEVWVRNH